ncbi:MAG TPA: cytochrome c [Steroidobacteraceae bacterium]|nr:cytochrome c [Steroidobacteraceae bacterium]
MIRLRKNVALFLALSACGSAAADPAPGKAVFDRFCAACHAPGPGHAGTERLAQARGASKAALEQRTDLTPDYIRLVVRNGLVEMPPWRLTEIDDAQLTQLVQYLTRPRK